MERRTFLQTLGALIGATGAPAVPMPATPERTVDKLFAEDTVENVASAASKMLIKSFAVHNGNDGATLQVEAYFAAEVMGELYAAFAERLHVYIDHPALRSVGIAGQDWVVTNYAMNAGVDELVSTHLSFRAAGPLKHCAILNESNLPMLKLP